MAFVVSKPLQFMIASMIAKQLHRSHHVDFLIVDNFAGAAEVVLRYPNEPFRSAWFCPSHEIAYERAREYGLVYTYCDVGVRNFRTLRQFRQVRVYEEGIGTYRTDLYPRWKSWLFRLFGIGDTFGAARMTESVHVFAPESYIAGGSAAKIEGTLADFVTENFAGLSRLFGMEPIPASVQPATLYLSDWGIDAEIVRSHTGDGAFYLKPHPHIRDFPGIESVNVLPAAVPAELLIIALAKAHPELTVYHHGSSAAHYLAGAPGVEFVRL